MHSIPTNYPLYTYIVALLMVATIILALEVFIRRPIAKRMKQNKTTE